MKKTFAIIFVCATIISSCSKSSSNNTTTEDFNTLETSVLKDFVNKTAIGGYADLKDKATNFNNVVTALNQNATDANLAAAQQAWRDMRSTWEQCEGYLLGPVEDDSYDPNMDTWPVDYVQMDSLLNSSNALEPSDIALLSTLSLRGYHPIEYVLWGRDGKRKAADITARQKKYITSLTTDLKATCAMLYDSWTTTDNYASKVLNAGAGTQPYAKKLDVYVAIVTALADICGEVGEGKMKEPYDAQDPKIVESPFSGNSATDFKNNIQGAYNVYMGNFLGNQGNGLNKLVAAKNISLDNKIQQQFAAAISSFNAITLPYEQAIISQRVQVQQAMTAIVTLKATLEGDLMTYIKTNIKD
ncbi:imelysin family protein [Chitinophaga sp. Cy-1792]|uniref:imelysin family protein n=1 Tax=Chitinophaga sp. Cy-1792 TaxID=2608339 RepID=UPI00141DE1A4|nr:imelysin family protein [Chitinophaga sp. Cy-1792]NIG55623.1 hypothetical protein [Chitinophaga sp. Cy-1792]